MLQPLDTDDIPALFQLFAQDESIRYLDLPASSRPLFERFINEVLASELLGFCLPKTIWHQGNLAGMILLTNICVENGTAEMGTWLGVRYQGQGLNALAKQEMLDIAFGEMRLHTVLLITTADNFRSKKALEKLPYVHLRNEKHQQLKKQKDFFSRHPHDIYEIRREDYLATSKL